MEDPAFTVLLTGPGPRGAEALRAVRAVTGLSLWRSRQPFRSAAHCAADSLTCCGCEICVRFGPLPGHSPGPGR
ncbi:hypothetical protein [Kitasatospora sp. NPDC059599]|uniref:hypothetical protein n=1 Tax=Kitasatospora sp. NPDC059599 TaxID=3346880 RepID=UPI0036B7DA43